MEIVKKKRKIFTPLIALLLVVVLSGCMNIMAEDLYTLPRLPNEFLRLQSIIDDLLDEGAMLSPPIGGTHRQGIQMRDLNSSENNEVLVFLYLPDEELLNLYIFTYDGGDYAQAMLIEVNGTAFESVRFVDLDGDGIEEIALGWQAAPLIRHMEVLSIVDFEVNTLARFNHIDFIDFDLTGDGHNDIIVIGPTIEGRGGSITLYSIKQSGEPIISSVELLGSVEEYLRIITGRLLDDTPAVFIESEVLTDEGHQVETEIFVFDGVDLIETQIEGLSN